MSVRWDQPWQNEYLSSDGVGMQLDSDIDAEPVLCTWLSIQKAQTGRVGFDGASWTSLLIPDGVSPLSDISLSHSYWITPEPHPTTFVTFTMVSIRRYQRPVHRAYNEPSLRR